MTKAELALSISYLREKLNYNKDTGIWTWIKPGRTRVDLIGTTAGTIINGRRGKRYLCIQIGEYRYLSSRLAHFYITGEWPLCFMDHINGDSLDDRWSNLREATATQNKQNIYHKKKKSNLPMGVSIGGRSKKYRAYICVNKKIMHLGTFNTIPEAESEYKKARKKYFGEFSGIGE